MASVGIGTASCEKEGGPPPQPCLSQAPQQNDTGTVDNTSSDAGAAVSDSGPPRDLGVHWVWLPLFHYLQAVAVWFGATLTMVRLANVLVSAAIPCVLFALLRSSQRDDQSEKPRGFDLVPLIAALLTALSPL